MFHVPCFNVSPGEVVWYCMVSRLGRPGDVHRMRNESVWKQCPEDLHGISAVWAVWTIANVADEDVTHCTEMFPEWLCTTLHSQLLYAPSHSQRNKDQKCHEINFTAHCYFCTVQKKMKFMWVVLCPLTTVLFIHITRHIAVSLIWH
jgi:hypothetical protein